MRTNERNGRGHRFCWLTTWITLDQTGDRQFVSKNSWDAERLLRSLERWNHTPATNVPVWIVILRSKPLRGVSSAENAFCDTVGKFLGKHASRKVILVVAGATLLKSFSLGEITFLKNLQERLLLQLFHYIKVKGFNLKLPF